MYVIIVFQPHYHSRKQHLFHFLLQISHVKIKTGFIIKKINLQFQNALIFNGIQIPLIKTCIYIESCFCITFCTLTGDSAVKYYHFFSDSVLNIAFSVLYGITIPLQPDAASIHLLLLRRRTLSSSRSIINPTHYYYSSYI